MIRVLRKRLPDSITTFLNDIYDKHHVTQSDISYEIKNRLSFYGIKRGVSTIMIDLSTKTVLPEHYDIYMDVFTCFGYVENDDDDEITDDLLFIFFTKVLNEDQREYCRALLKEETK